MIEQLNGKCVYKDEQSIIFEVNGVGYGLLATAALLQSLEETSSQAEQTLIWVHTHVREDQITLFGFDSMIERKLFRLLISVNRIGPKVAMGILSALSVEEIIRATFDDDTTTLTRAPKIGSAQAKKLILELKPKLNKIEALSSLIQPQKAGAVSNEAKSSARISKQTCDDLHSALVNLGYKDKEVIPVVSQLAASPTKTPISQLLRQALGLLGSGVVKEQANDMDQIF